MSPRKSCHIQRTELEQQPDAYVDKLDIAMPGYVERAEDFIGNYANA